MELGTKQRYGVVYGIAAFFLILGLLASRFDMAALAQGLWLIFRSSGILITDYIALAGTGPTFVNAGLVILVTGALMDHYGLKLDGVGIMTVGFMAGFSMFGKNLVNMWFMLFGTRMYCRIKRTGMKEHLTLSLMSTALGPIVSNLLFYQGVFSVQGLIASFAVGTVIGLVAPSLSTHTAGVLNDLSLYNGGFALGLLAMVICPVLKAYGWEFQGQDLWATGYNKPFGIGLLVICGLFVLAGFVVDKDHAWTNYKNILKRPGKPKDDFTRLDGLGAALVNIGINGALATLVVVFVMRGDLNGATMGGIISIMGCSARGKHAKNILPVMAGIVLAAHTNIYPSHHHGLQLALLFGTSLAPIAGTYGWPIGVLAGFIHASVVLFAGAGYSGVNLYNNGFCAGLVAVVMWPMLRALLKPNTYSQPSESVIEEARQKEMARLGQPAKQEEAVAE